MKIIKAKNGREIIVDDEDFEYLSSKTWYFNGKGYASRYAGDRYLLPIHREIMGLERGDKRVVDHINGDPTDNRRSNLRICTVSQNLMNRGANSNSKSGFKGVSPCHSNGRWRATINIAGSKQKHLGYFDTPEEAHAAYVEAAKQFHGEFATM